MKPAHIKLGRRALEAVLPEDSDLGAITVRGYLMELLRTLWDEGEGFSGKRPFGNSGWQSDVVKALVGAGVVDGRLDADGYIADYNRVDVDRAMRCAVEYLETVAGAHASALSAIGTLA